MRILAVTDSHPPYHYGGYELRCKAILDGLGSRGHDVLIITSRESKVKRLIETENQLSRVLHREYDTRGPLRGIIDEFSDVMYLDRTIRIFKPDVVYLGHIINLTRALFPYLAETAIPVVMDEGGKSISWSFSHRGPWYGLIGRRSNSGIKNFVKCAIRCGVNMASHNNLKTAWLWPSNISGFFNSQSVLQNTLAEGVLLRDARVIHSGVDTNEIVFSERTFDSKDVRLITPGRIEPVKGTRDAILLLDCLRRKSIGAKLTIVGGRSSPDYYDDLIVEINRLGLQDSVAIVPQVEYGQMTAYYLNSDFCFFPSYQKVGLSRIPLEAMASGCIVITYGNEGSSEIIKHGFTGYIVPEAGVELAADVINSVLTSSGTIRGVTSNARQVVEQYHSLDGYVDAVESFLLHVVRKSAATRKPRS